jgi:hypothetical protein
VKTLARIALIVLAAGLFVELTGIYADFQPRSPRLRWESERRRRPPEPQLDRTPSFLGEFVVIGMIALAGRKVLGLRLADSRLP